MPNGRNSPHCIICKNYIDSKNRRSCLKHRFVLPKVGYHILCKDFCDKINESGLDVAEELDINTLYYYIYDNQSYDKLDTFDNLQQLVLGIWIKKIDKYYEIIKNNNEFNMDSGDFFIEIHENDSRYFSNTGSKVILIAEKLNLSSIIYEIFYRQNNNKSRKNLIIVGPGNSIYEWLACHFDMAYIIRKINGDKFLNLDTGFPAFLKINKLQSRFTLMPDYLYFKLLFGLASIRDEKYLSGFDN